MNKIGLSGYIDYPKYIHQVAEIVGEMRDAAKKKKMAENDYFDRGDNNLRVSAQGVAAELIFYTHLWRNDIPFKESKLYDPQTSIGYDVFISENCKIDVKGLKRGDREFTVNERAHKRKSMVTHYAFVQIISQQKARFWIFPYSSISSWQLKQLTYTPAYCKAIPDDNQIDLFKSAENGQ